MESPAIRPFAAGEDAPHSPIREHGPDCSAGGESALLNRLQCGEPGAEGAFFARYERDVRNVLTRIMGATPDVADALQDTFIRAFRSALQVRQAMALRAWMRRVATSVAFDHLRERQRLRWQFSSTRALLDAPAEGVSPERQATSLDIHRILEKLPDAERAAVRLRYIEEMAMGEIAAACNCSLATIKRRLARAETRFRSLALQQPGLTDWILRKSAKLELDAS